MTVEKPTFSINSYDKDGDAYEKGVYIHIGSHVRLHFDSPEELQSFAKSLLAMDEEIKENLQ